MDNTTLSKEQFFEWRTLIEQMLHCETKKELQQIKAAIFEKEIEILKLKQATFLTSVRAANDNLALAKKSYEDYKVRLEQELGHSLNNCTIDEYTYEVKKLD